MTKISVLLIAAGESKRMGSPKQLLAWGNKTLIEHQIEVLQQLNLPIYVVLGANSELIQNKIQYLNCEILFNKNWKKGMGNSIAFGVKNINENQNFFHGILIALVDQPLIEIEHYQKMIDVFKNGKNQIIVSKSSAGIEGAPVIFDNYYFEPLTELSGEKGAKIVTQKYPENVISVFCESSLEDMDTPEIYQKMLKLTNPQS